MCVHASLSEPIIILTDKFYQVGNANDKEL